MTDTSASRKKAGLIKLGLRLFQGILPFDRSRVLADIFAGLTLAAVGIPEVMGYTQDHRYPGNHRALHDALANAGLCDLWLLPASGGQRRLRDGRDCSHGTGLIRRSF
jgi:hypothetical protein